MSPFIYSSILLAICFFILLLFNYKLKKKSINYLFLIFSLVYLIIIILLDDEFVYQFLRSVSTYIWYPNYLIFVIVILFSIIILMITILNNQKNRLLSIISYLLFSICLSCYIIFISLDIDPTLYSSIYQENSLILMRTVTISLLIWILIQIYVKVRGKNEK